MIIICGDCYKKFSLEDIYLVMLSESIRMNKNLKIICSDCGWKIIDNFHIKDV
jgi:hypothetical protein